MTTAAESIANTKMLLNEALNDEIVIVNRQMLRAFKKVVKEARKHVSVLIEDANNTTQTKPPVISDEQFKSELRSTIGKIRDNIIEFLKKNTVRGIKFLIKAIPRIILEPIALMIKNLILGMSVIGALGFAGPVIAIGAFTLAVGTAGAALATIALAGAALSSGAGLVASVAGAIASVFAGLVSGVIISSMAMTIIEFSFSLVEIFADIYSDFSYEINSELDNRIYVMIDKAVDNAFSKLLD
jgi:hypothetical protein